MRRALALLARRGLWSGLCAGILFAQLPSASHARGRVIGVSWSNFQEERWKTDEAAIRAGLEAAGARYVSADAQSSSEKQLADIEGLIARGAEALIVLAQDSDAIVPALAAARAEGIPVIAYDRLIESPEAFYISFDNVEVGRLQAQAIADVRPEGRYVFIKGSAQDPNSDFVHRGQLEVLRPAIAAGRIEVVGDQYVDRWLPELAERVMEQILTANADRVDAIVCSNDGMAGGVVAALAGQGLEGIPVSGQDGDHAALARVALGTQTVSVWKDARALGKEAARVALALAAGRPAGEITGTRRWSGGPRGVEVDAILLTPIAITRDNLDVVIDAGWVPRSVICRGARAPVPAACR
jgi:D-xylose transport system substrate-binding protein